MNEAVRIEGDVVLNGISMSRCRDMLLRGTDIHADATPAERAIIKRVLRKVDGMRSKGYGPKDTARMAQRWLKDEAVGVKG